MAQYAVDILSLVTAHSSLDTTVAPSPYRRTNGRMEGQENRKGGGRDGGRRERETEEGGSERRRKEGARDRGRNMHGKVTCPLSIVCLMISMPLVKYCTASCPLDI